MEQRSLRSTGNAPSYSCDDLPARKRKMYSTLRLELSPNFHY